MVISQPTARPSGTTPAGDIAGGTIGTSLQYARADHAHPIEANEMIFQNAADAGKKFQRAIGNVTVSTSHNAGAFFTAQTAVSWAATFATTPTAEATVSTTSSNVGACVFSAGLNTITTTGFNLVLAAESNGNNGNAEIWGLG